VIALATAGGFWLALGLVGLGLWLAHDGLVQPVRPKRAGGASLRERMGDWLLQAGLEGVTLPMLVCTTLAGALAGGLLVHALLGWPVADLVGGVAGGLAYPVWLRSRHARQRDRVRQALVEVIERIRDAVASGLDVGAALVDLAQNGPEVLRPQLQQLVAELRAGVPFAEAVEALRRRLADPTFDLVAEALILRDEVGGDRFGACLDQVARGVRAQIALRGRLAAARGRLYLSARILALLPLGLLVYLRWSSPTAARAYQTAIGQEVLAGAALVIVVGYVATLWLARLDEDERVLVRPS
jgi:tight adherence protein B